MYCLTMRAPGRPNFDAWFYAWHVSKAGTVRTGGKRRQLQVQVLNRALGEMNPDGYTVLLGFDAETGIFVGVDVARHSEDRNTDPAERRKHHSILFDEKLLGEAVAEGICYRKYSSGEIVFGIRPDHLGHYVGCSIRLHECSDENLLQDCLANFGPRTCEPADLSDWMGETDNAGAYGFSEEVKEAYKNKCPVTGSGSLLHSHHIYPRRMGDSIHLVCNGIPLDVKIHALFHKGLLYLRLDQDGRYRVCQNEDAYLEDRVSEEDFLAHRSLLKDKLLHLPDNPDDWPDPMAIRMAYEAFGIKDMADEWPTEAEKKAWRKKHGIE